MQRLLTRIGLAMLASASLLVMDADSSLGCWRCRRARRCEPRCNAAPCQPSSCASAAPTSSCGTSTQAEAAAPTASSALACICLRQKLIDLGSYKIYAAHQHVECVSDHCNTAKPCTHANSVNYVLPQDCRIPCSCLYSPCPRSNQYTKEEQENVDFALPAPLPADVDLRSQLAEGWVVIDEQVGWITPVHGERMRVKFLVLKSATDVSDSGPPLEFGFGFEVKDDGKESEFEQVEAHSHLGGRYRREFTLGGRTIIVIGSR